MTFRHGAAKLFAGDMNDETLDIDLDKLLKEAEWANLPRRIKTPERKQNQNESL